MTTEMILDHETELSESNFISLLFSVCLSLEKISTRTSLQIPEEVKSQRRRYLTSGLLCPINETWYLADDWIQIWANKKLYKKGGYTPDWKERAREIRRSANYCCEKCNVDCESSTGRILTVHHIDSNKKNNHNLNLVALCWPCHRKIQRDFVVGQVWSGYSSLFKELNNKNFEEEHYWAYKRGYKYTKDYVIIAPAFDS